MLIISVSSLLFVSCSIESKELNVPEINGKYFTQFTLNVHDWVFPEKSIAAVNRTIDIHEEYRVPVDIYLNDQVFQIYLDQAPELIERLKTSEYVTVNYHIRAPHLVYNGFDIVGLNQMPPDELYATLLAFEEHKLDLETGEYSNDLAGGYQLVKDAIGYAPISLGFSATGIVEDVYSRVLQEKGGKLYVMHGDESNLGDAQDGLYLRPEHVEIKWYEEVRRYVYDEISAEDLILINLEEHGYTNEDEKLFINMKMHENNYYTDGTSFAPTYWGDGVSKQDPADPPYNLTKSVEETIMREQWYTDAMWEWYELAVQTIAENPDTYYATSNKEILEWLE